MDKSPLARVPPELRSLIYQYVLRSGLVIGQRNERPARGRQLGCAQKLVPAQVCREMRQEFLYDLFTLNPTHVRVLGHYATPGLSNFIAELPDACERALTIIEEMPDSLRSQRTVYVLEARFRASPLFEDNFQRVTDDQYALAIKSLGKIAQQVRPHSVDLSITCAYFSLPYANYLYECVDFPRKGRDLDYFRLRIPVNDISGAYAILRSSLRQQLLEIESHSSHQLCSVRHCKVDLTKDLVRTANFFGELIEKLAVQSLGDGNAAPPKKPAFKLRFIFRQTEVVDVTSKGYRVALEGNYLELNNPSTFGKRLTYDGIKGSK